MKCQSILTHHKYSSSQN
ncbi:unnamed protein product [Acanthoscelides obtectus]|uniref:Uncharacterized protein n=1 Tax=Acanthoscelides obtectus TaxID=200917 RepID=A0A9P0PE51_ACAOB|nr:unnamed protein product [Acanthoscelides obtectus]CAK1655690.1 hypothetical protein AOBTE_LOCUS19263 [Acanthoscelides obtectus]